MTVKYTPELGGNKERSVTYQTKFCRTQEEIDDFINKDKYAYSYIYWNPVALGVFITLCKPNPKSFLQKQQQPKIERGLIELSEADALKETIALAPLEDNEAEILLARLYEHSYRLFKPLDKVKQ